MPRTLPWLVNKPKADPAPKKTIASVGRAPKAPLTTISTNEPTPKPKEPINIDDITADSYIEGPTGDDQWKMVEDELLFTAQEFTKSIHRAELERLQQQAKLRTEDGAFKPLEPLTETTVPVMKKRKQAARIRAAADESTDDELAGYDDVFGKTKLGSLMTSPQRAGRNLAALAPARPATKAAAGYTRDNLSQQLFKKEGSPPSTHSRSKNQPSSHRDDTTEDEDEEDYDLDAPAPAKRKPPVGPTFVESKVVPSLPSSVSSSLPTQTVKKEFGSTSEPQTSHSSGRAASRRPTSVDEVTDPFVDLFSNLLPSIIKRERS